MHGPKTVNPASRILFAKPFAKGTSGPIITKLISKIDMALKRIEVGSYGYCEETGEPIGLKRLIARPVATLSIEAQEKHERDEKIFVED